MPHASVHCYYDYCNIRLSASKHDQGNGLLFVEYSDSGTVLRSAYALGYRFWSIYLPTSLRGFVGRGRICRKAIGTSGKRRDFQLEIGVLSWLCLPHSDRRPPYSAS